MGRIGKKVLSWTLCLMMAVGMLPGMTRKAKATEAADVGISWDSVKKRYVISNYAGLVEFANIVNGTGAHAGNANSNACAIISDEVGEIDASASNPKNQGYDATLAWTPIGNKTHPYTGTFDGNGKKIEGLTFDNSSQDYAGLFGYVGTDGTGGTVRNVVLEGGLIAGNSYVGGVVGFNEGTVENCHNTGAVSGNSDTGGVVGYNPKGTVENCYNTGAVSGNSDVGGVVGNNRGTVENCYNTDAVTGAGGVGGVVGNNSNTVKNCYNTSTVYGDGNNVGGVVGNNKGTVENCCNTGAVTGAGDIVGGVVGYNPKGTVENCYNTGAVSGDGNRVGGVVGYNATNGTVENCYNTGAVSGNVDYVGGVVGFNATNGTVENCYNTGAVSGNSDVGGVVGYNPNGTVENCYNTSAVSGNSDVGGVIGFNPNGTVENCYNTGAVSGNSDVGGVVGFNPTNGTVENCYYDICTCQIGKPIGEGANGTGVTGLTTAQMTGENALNDMGLSDSVWLSKSDGAGDERQYYLYYPQLKGFNYKADGKPETDSTKISSDNWPAKVEVKVSWNEPDSYTYDGSEKNPTVTSIIVGDDSIPDGASVSYYAYGSSTWGEPTSDAPDSPGLYKMECDVAGEKVTKYFSILSPGVDYAVSCLKLVNEKWEQSTERINSGEYKAVISWTEKGHAIIEKTFDILPASVTLTANSKDTDIYDGTEKSVSGLTCSIEGLTFDGVSANGKGIKQGKYDVTFSGVTLNDTKDTTGNYVVTGTTNGTLTINKKPLTITASSETKVYDGTALAKDSYTNSGLASGDTIESVTVTGTQTAVGTSDNVPSAAKIVNASGEDVTGCYDITYVNGTLTVTKPAAPKLADDQKPAPKQDLKEDGKDQILVLDPANLPEGYTIEYSTDGGKTWKPIPTGKESGEYTIEVFYKADENHTDFFGDPLNVIIQGVYNQTESDGDWTKGSGKTYTFRIKKAFNDEATYDNLTGVFVDGKKAEPGKDYTPAKGSAIITFAADYLETLSVGEHKIRVTFKDGEVTVPLKVLATIVTPAPAVDATPTTGDTSMPILWATLILLSMAGATVVVMRRRKRA